MLFPEPMTIAILAHCALTSRRVTSLPRARVWLRRQCESIVDTLMQETTEPLLDATNVVDPRVLLVSIVLLVLLRFVIARGGFRR